MGVVIEMAGEISFLAQGNLGPRSRRLAGCFPLTRLVGQISPANGALVAHPNGTTMAPVRGRAARSQVRPIRGMISG